MKYRKKGSTSNKTNFFTDLKGKEVAFINLPIMDKVEVLASKARLSVELHKKVLKNGCYPDYEAVRKQLRSLSELYYVSLVIKEDAAVLIDHADEIEQTEGMLGESNV